MGSMRALFLVAFGSLLLSACVEKEPVIHRERTPRRVEKDVVTIVEDRRGMVARIEPPEIHRPASTCEPGQVKACAGWVSLPSLDPASQPHRLMMHCRRLENGTFGFDRED